VLEIIEMLCLELNDRTWLKTGELVDNTVVSSSKAAEYNKQP